MTLLEMLNYVMKQVIAGNYDVSGFRLLMDCPLPECHGARKQKHFYVNREWLGWKCYRQGLHGSFRNLVHDNPRVWTPIRRLDDRGASRASPVPVLALDDLIPLSEYSERVFASQRQRAYEYVMSRGVTPAQVLDYRISVMPQDSRVWFPFWTKAGVCSYRMGRLLWDDLGVKTYEEGSPDKPFFGSHVREPVGILALVEGVFDHFATPCSHAVMGSSLGVGQLAQLKAWFSSKQIDRAFWLYDPDAKDKARAEVLRVRKQGVPVVGCFIEGSDSDPGKLGPGVMGRIVKHLRSVSLQSLQSTPFLTAFVPRMGSDHPFL